MEPLRVLELYSGIGGMHQALRESCIPAQVVAAVDVNNIANEVYNYNFPHTQLLAKTIEGITLEEFERLSFDMILMSPPCQPFTRIGLQGDVTDPRTNSFIYILDILPRLQKLPKFILLENVKGFEISSTRDLLIQTIESCGFQYQEFLLSPTSLGIPNSRLRYFLVAKLQSEPLPFQAPGQVLMEFPKIECEHTQKRAVDAENTIEGKKIEPNVSFDSSKQCSGKEAILFKLETAGEIERKHQQDSDLSVQMLKDFLEDDADTSQYFLPPKPLLRYALLLDIVKPTCRRSMCFTKGYGRYIEGTGSVLQTAEDVQIENIYKSLTSLSQEEKIKKLLMLKLRYFTPKEIANLHGFPPEFGFPETVTMKQRYRLLGNSLNVHIVAKLIKILCE
ncbi:tRNA (cytosine(38)-C(5))-methyltransferase isoform X1 [Pteropus medius]|uniref:tRNA (cytosine(38)-C(5))-methyltransferase n=2 Tax=Pteropus vampyrus TaxID=132908 RepID=A0A6P6CMY8_PTEVA|nr:tRNA (cytosine(38)-C(5))-methyltransferase isoform X1 [Pteropus vampyrus]XP_023388871.1 tRNA (cytosine(38)-C(5))-methyltransferase isoform X1 [Pteropus vampyrus]XP_023388872.1 tRNA (cytosine(38)-C(5))-methyltransferase isoform X1 [Pteropus vampyrus]XP_039733417.1 tRNA (cytosine(38)-C(5))-methyltransferase isoform X1 [Pteropus giganteus]XP_039733418.1 tRNA (cytosine(38)-C(5))-methyltransferase isoform X1 [Pteropus giganteus]XP_039733419.1 tRNA (cytosine(38)-C(5))-methyltransferase isoform X1